MLLPGSCLLIIVHLPLIGSGINHFTDVRNLIKSFRSSIPICVSEMILSPPSRTNFLPVWSTTWLNQACFWLTSESTSSEFPFPLTVLVSLAFSSATNSALEPLNHVFCLFLFRLKRRRWENYISVDRIKHFFVWNKQFSTINLWLQRAIMIAFASLLIKKWNLDKKFSFFSEFSRAFVFIELVLWKFVVSRKCGQQARSEAKNFSSSSLIKLLRNESKFEILEKLLETFLRSLPPPVAPPGAINFKFARASVRDETITSKRFSHSTPFHSPLLDWLKKSYRPPEKCEKSAKAW